MMDQATRDNLNAFSDALASYSRYYDRRGYPMPMATWAECFEDPAYKRIALTRLPGGRKWVSTVWLGLDHQWGAGSPLIFESMVFGRGMSELDTRRYSTEEEAREGHHLLVKWWRLNRCRRRTLHRKGARA
jgi:hypothetical protein